MSKIYPEVIAPDASGYNKNPESLTDKKIDKKLEVNNCNSKSVTHPNCTATGKEAGRSG